MATRVRGGRARSRPPEKPDGLGGSATLPTLTHQKANENKSRPLFELAIHPWLFQDSRHDHGIDGEVEITQPREGSTHHDVTAKRFLVQLKSTDGDLVAGRPVPARIRSMHVRYWTESNLPVLLTRCHLPTKRFFWRWIDEGFVAELSQADPGWIGKDELTVHLPADSRLDSKSLGEIEAFVYRYRRAARRILAPGTYMDLQTRALATGVALEQLAKEAAIDVVGKRLSDLRDNLTRCTYVVGLTGPTRAGKSTLMNALVGREISPIGRAPTTAVPVMLVAGPKDEAEVTFLDGHSEKGPATATFLAQFATQDRNPDNEMQVKLATVRLVNDQLERGIALADAPGLHDPSEAMRKITDVALDAAHAVVYVLDVSPARNWGFFISEQTIADLRRLRTKAQRLFIVLNKDDDVPPENREHVRSYVERELKKYGLWSDLPIPPMFLSAKAAWDWDRKGTSPIAELEDAVWTHLLRTQSTGVDRLSGALVELSRAGHDLGALLAVRQANTVKAGQLRQSLEACRRRREELLSDCQSERQSESGRLAALVEENSGHVRGSIEKWLKAIPVNQSLPSIDKIREHLHEGVMRTLQTTWEDASSEAQRFAHYVSSEVERSLAQARAALGSVAGADVRFIIPTLQGMNSLAPDSLSEAWTGLLAAGLFGLLIQSPLFWAIAIGGWFVGLILGNERRRNREIGRIMAKVDAALASSSESIHVQVFEKVSTHLSYLESHVLDRIVVFTKDAERQIGALSLPPGAERGQPIENWQARVGAAAESIVSIARELDPALLPSLSMV